MTNARNVLLVLLLSCFPTLACADAETLDWHDYNKRIPVANHVDYLEEAGGPLTLDEVRSRPESAWTTNDSENISLGYGSEVYWFRMKINYTGRGTEPVFLEIAYPVLDHVDVHVLYGNEPVKTHSLGDKLSFYERPIYHRNFVVPLELVHRETVTVFLRVETTSSMQVPLVLWNPDAFYAAEQSRSLFEGLYYGIILVMVLYNLFVFMAVGERSFLYYVGYITAAPLFLASLHGVAFQYLWPEATWWNDQAIIVFLNLLVVMGGVFTIRFINVTRSNHPVLNAGTWVVVGSTGLMAVTGLLVPYHYLILPTIILAAIGCSLMLVLGILRWIRNDPAARYYTMAWVFMLFGGIVLALSKFTVLPRNLLTENATQVGSALGVILLSIALADRLNKEKTRAFEAQQRLLREERKARLAQEKSLRIQQEANSLLEKRVQERTRDLESLNEQLLELNATDALTGLKNRGHFDRTFLSASVKAFRFGQPLSLLVLDIDHFKQFNDTYGHLVGDDCLQMVAHCIRQYVTRPEDLAARFGGEEFVVLLPDTPEEGAVRVAEKIRREIERTDFRISDEVLHLTVSIGVCTVCPDEADATKDIFCRADEALYEAKGQGRNRVVTHRTAPQEATPVIG